MHYATHFTLLGVTNGVAKCADIIYETIYYHGHLFYNDHIWHNP